MSRPTVDEAESLTLAFSITQTMEDYSEGAYFDLSDRNLIVETLIGEIIDTVESGSGAHEFESLGGGNYKVTFDNYESLIDRINFETHQTGGTENRDALLDFGSTWEFQVVSD